MIHHDPVYSQSEEYLGLTLSHLFDAMGAATDTGWIRSFCTERNQMRGTFATWLGRYRCPPRRLR